jgi:REP element-mobilizing transposase RayT
MVIAYHAIFTTYGTWLPNDPRGSYSKAIYNAELASLGPIRYGRQSPLPDFGTLRRFQTAAIPRLSRPPCYITDATRLAVAEAFGGEARRLGLTVFACAIMKDHVHLVILRSAYRIEYVVNQLKGGATRALELQQTPWARGAWKVFLDDEAALWAAVEYVEANPPAAGLAPQAWGFVSPVPGRDHD